MAGGKIILGLGNPGAAYEGTYHNAGVLAVRAMADAADGLSEGADGTAAWKMHKKSGNAVFLYRRSRASGRNGGTAAFVLPLAFMNQSGAAAKEALKFFAAAPEDLIIVHDDSDLPVGTYKIAEARGAAGHKGVASVIAAFGTNRFTRIRIGIRNPREVHRKKAEEFVLKKISARDHAALAAVFREIAGKFPVSG